MKLHLKVNESTISVGKDFGRNFLDIGSGEGPTIRSRLKGLPKSAKPSKPHHRNCWLLGPRKPVKGVWATEAVSGRDRTVIFACLKRQERSETSVRGFATDFGRFSSTIEKAADDVLCGSQNGYVPRGGHSSGTKRPSLVASQPVSPQSGSHRFLL